jgi:hypothetical protein
MDHGVSGTTTDTIFYSSGDNYIRKNNATGLRGSLNVPTRTGGDASGTWNINITGSASTTGNAATATALTTASGSAPSYAARAWVNFNGTGTVAIRASGNVSSISDLGTGNYVINFTTAMQDTNYALVSYATNASNATPAGLMTFGNNSVVTTTSITVKTVVSGNYGAVDTDIAGVAIFR